MATLRTATTLQANTGERRWWSTRFRRIDGASIKSTETRMTGLRIVITTAIGEPHQTARPGYRKIAVSMLRAVVRGSTIRDHCARPTSSGSLPPPGFEILVFGLGGLLADDFFFA
jgi:hypothetical protein